MHVRLLVGAAGVVLVASCSSGAGGPTARPAPGPACRSTATAPSGYAMTGEASSAVLRPVRLCPIQLGEPIALGSGPPRLSWVSGTGTNAVAADFGTGVDRVYRVTTDGVAAVPGLDVGHSPTLGPDGRIAFVVQDLTGPERRFVVRLFDPTTRVTTTVARLAGPPSGPVWTGTGQLAFITDTRSDNATVVVLDRPDAPLRRLATVGANAVNLHALSHGDLAVVLADGPPELAHTVVLDRRGREHVRVDKWWRPVGTTTDGALVVVHRDTREIARLAGPGFSRPEPYGVLPAGEQVWQVVL